MKDFKSVIREINRTLNDFEFLDALLSAVVFFLVIFLLLSLFNFYSIFAVYPALVYLILITVRKFRKDKIAVVEAKHPMLKEKLRTAAEFKDEENIIVAELHSEIVADLKNVRTSSFIDRKKMFKKTVILAVLCFVVVFASSYDVELLKARGAAIDALKDLPVKWEGVIGDFGEHPFQLTDDLSGGYTGEDNLVSEDGINEDIYGGKSVAVLGDETVDIEIKPMGFEVSIMEEREAKIPDTFSLDSDVYDDEVGKMTKENQDLVKNYFKFLAEE